MTRKHKFKVRVRARMGRTGEGYSLARRHALKELGHRSEHEPTVHLGNGQTNIVAWCTHHALIVVDQLVEMASQLNEIPWARETLLDVISPSLYDATKLAALGTGVWDVEHRSIILDGGWATLRVKYAAEFANAPAALSFRAGEIRTLRETHGSQLRCSAFAYDMQGWHGEKTGNVLRGLAELRALLPASDGSSSALYSTVTIAEQAALELWSLTTSENPPKATSVVEAEIAGERARHRAMLDAGVPPEETCIERMTADDMALLLASADDASAHHVLWIDTQHRVHLEALPTSLPPGHWAELNKARILLRQETLVRGNGYCGPDAALDRSYVERTLRDLRFEVMRGTTGYIGE
jgi:hypothetical protein